MPLDVETIVTVLKENAERFHSLAKVDPPRADSFEAQALKCENLVDKITRSSPASHKARGSWIFCPQWLYPDNPQWAQEEDCYNPTSAVESDVEDLRPMLTEALRVAPTKATHSGEDETWQITDEDVQGARFVKPKFLPGVILAQLTKEVAKDDAKEAWTAFFPLFRMRAELTRPGASTSRPRSCTD